MSGTQEPGNVLSHLMQLLHFNKSFAHWWRLVETNCQKSTSCICKGANIAASGVTKEGVGQAEWFGSKNATSVEGSSQVCGWHKLEVPGDISCPHQCFANTRFLSNLLGFLESSWEVVLLHFALHALLFFFLEEGKGSGRKGTGREGMLLSLPNEEAVCNKSVNLGCRKRKLTTTSGLVPVKLGKTLCLFCK